MDDDIIIKILKTVNNLPDLNQENVIEKVKGEFKSGSDYSTYCGTCEGLKEIEFNINHPLVERGDDKTLLHYAAKGGCEKITDALIGKWADVNVKDLYGNTPLHYAAEEGHVNTLRVLLEEEVDVDVKSAAYGMHIMHKYTPLHLAAHNGHLDIVNALIEKGAYAYATCYPETSSYDKICWSGTPLGLAMRNGHWNVVNALVEKEKNNLLENKIGNPRYYQDIVRKVQEKQAFKRGIFVGGGVTLAGAIIATALFATGVIAVETLTVLAAVSIVAAAGLAVGGVTYLISKPKTEVHEAKTDQQKQDLKFSNGF
ncbi:ankyrin repeat domain-containing protein [Wolbachia endosymbiont (group A) of Ennomos erosarius]|uniref:ankyrin repeat domain-containing protein n=1 Tax=Wolbachia endosymbiont (group A) of Ennomos erosarius TaxID=3066174 RepID=UPI00333E3A6C